MAILDPYSSLLSIRSLITGRLEFLESPTLKAASVRATPQPHPSHTTRHTPATPRAPACAPRFHPTIPPPTQWIRVVPSASAKRLVKMIDHYWRLPKPEVLITVTGGAQELLALSVL